MAASKLSLKLLIDIKNNRVLFAEADKNTVDFLFHVLSLPVATIIRLLSKQGMVGCLANLYDSIENLNEIFILPNKSKDILLKPRPPAGVSVSIPLLSLTYKKTIQNTAYRCNNGSNRRSGCGGNYFSDDPLVICPYCGNSISTKMTYVASPAVKKQKEVDEGGFVKGVVTYMVMDDLEVKPMRTISSIALLKKFNVKEVGELEEKMVDLDMNQALALLRTSWSLGLFLPISS